MPIPLRRGDIILAEVRKDETRGTEQYKIRPWVVISRSSLHSAIDMVVAVPLSTKIHKQNRWFRILIPESEKIQEPGTSGCLGDSLALTEQVRVLSLERITHWPRIARLTQKALGAVEAGVAYVLDMK